MITSFEFLMALFPALRPFRSRFLPMSLELSSPQKSFVSLTDQIRYLVLFVMVTFLFSFREFAAKIPRPFSVRYNPYTQSVEVLDSKDQIMKLANDIRGDVSTLHDALSKYEQTAKQLMNESGKQTNVSNVLEIHLLYR